VKVEAFFAKASLMMKRENMKKKLAITDRPPADKADHSFRLFKNTDVSTLLVLGLGLIFSLVVVLGILAGSQAKNIWAQTEGMYNHPLQVRRAISELTTDILNIQLTMEDLVLSATDGLLESRVQAIAAIEINAQKQIEILATQYLGPSADVVAVNQFYNQWKTSREETIRLVSENRAEEARQRIITGQIQDNLLRDTLASLDTINQFALRRGDQFYQDASTLYSTLQQRLVLVGVIIGLLCLLISYFLIRSIRNPLNELTGASEQFQAGDYGTRIRYASGNEFGVLAASLNRLAATIQGEFQAKERMNTITTRMLSEDHLQVFCNQVLDELMQATGSQIGAVYLLNTHESEYQPFETIGLDNAARASFSASLHDGEFGVALVQKKIQHIRDIPSDSLLHFHTVNCDFKPREIITIPILSGNDIPAVVSLASLRAYSAESLRLVQDISSLISARLNRVMASEQIRQFSERLEHQNSELGAQKRELEQQTQELNEQNLELEQQKKQLGQASQMKSNFLSNMSHELRTPLNSVIALSGVLNRHLHGMIPEEEYSYLEVIERNGKHLLELINDILDLSRLESGRQEVNLGPFSVHELTGEVIDMILPQANLKKIGLLNQVPGDLPSVNSDYSLCQHILQNLVANAVKFTEVGQVEIRAAQSGQNIQIDVVDTGIGIPADRIPYIFDEFRQGDESTARKYGGTGLGLTIAQRYADLLQGSIQVHSAPGAGSIFSLLLPLRFNTADLPEEIDLEPVGMLLPRAPSQKQAAASPSGQTILLVDDNEPALIQLKDILAEQGYNLLEAHNGREALEKMGPSLPDAVILDLMMPEVDGFEVLRQVRSTERTSGLPVLILTAKQISKEELKFLKKNNIHQLIQKGNIKRADLLEAVNNMTLPKAQVVASQAPEPARKASSEKPLILVVEDNPDNLLAVRALLGDSCRLVEAMDGQAGVEQARLYHPDLILMDISLPVMDGIQALKALRDDPSLRKIPVVALTASAMKGSREEILAHGFDAYVAKPIDVDLLKKTMREVLGGN
jgi:signal transduction histidine kinase/CheY-like chemotaxis protein/HAMP domain-containing protein